MAVLFLFAEAKHHSRKQSAFFVSMGYKKDIFVEGFELSTIKLLFASAKSYISTYSLFTITSKNRQGYLVKSEKVIVKK